MFNLVLEYNPNTGRVIPDGQVNKDVDALLELANTLDTTYVFGTENILYEIRARVADGTIEDPSFITVKFNNKTMTVNKNGTLSAWPHGFCDYSTQALARICSSKRKN